MCEKGHDVYVYDTNPQLMQEINRGFTSLYEPNIQDKLKNALASGRYHVTDLKTAVENSDIIFIAVPTPSQENKSFKTTFVKDAARDIVYFTSRDSYKTIVVISTVLPQTIRNEILPIINEARNQGKLVGLCYNAYFIAMGSTCEDWVDPEFVLIGEECEGSINGNRLESFYRTVIPRETPILRMTYEEAELTKMGYNVFISFKITTANALMEMADKIPHLNVDVVSNALSLATRRIVGPRYLRGGMGDSGGCHPRDADALSWLCDKLDLSANPFKYVMEARYNQTKYLANLAISLKGKCNLPLVVLGKRFKAKTNLTDYSCSFLLSSILHTKCVQHTIYDPLLDGERKFDEPCLFVATVMDDDFYNFHFPQGSVVIDVWRFLKEQEGVTYYRVGGQKDGR